MPAFSGYAKTGYSQPGYYKVMGAITPPVSMAFGITSTVAWPSVTAAVSRWQAPGPYGIVSAILLATAAGVRAFSAVALDPVYTTPPALKTYVNLLDLDAIGFGQTGAGSTLISRVSAIEQPSFRFTLDNSDGMVSVLLATEVVIGAIAAIFLDYGGGTNTLYGQAKVQRVQMRRLVATFTCGI